MKLINNDCIAAMKEMPDNSVDSIVTDPPYGLEFMGKDWDAPWKKSEVVEITDKATNGIFHDKGFNHGIRFSRGQIEMQEFQKWCESWAIEALRVLKPGGHCLAFGGSRTYHRLASGLEDAGFEIRDQIMWVYGSGFPKSHNIAKTLDKSENKEVWENNEYGGGNSKCDNCGKWMISGSPCQCPKPVVEFKTAAAKQWQGWGTALKPAHEPIVLARKPLIGTVAANVLTYGVGGLNIDASRVGRADGDDSVAGKRTATFGTQETESGGDGSGGWEQNSSGRWPANFIHDGSDEVVALFPDSKAPKQYDKKKAGWLTPGSTHEINELQSKEYGDSGSAARFFYCAKASKKDRNEGLDGFISKFTAAAEFRPNHMEKALEGESGNPYGRFQPVANHHPTVKPTDLMRYLCRLITPPNGIVLDPFMGSGSTGKACALEGFNFIGIDQSAEYVEIARARIAWAKENV